MSITETTHTRSRRAALKGLIVQLLAFGALQTLANLTHSTATWYLSWYVLGGAPIWFVTLLVFRQRELAELEQLDIEALRREKETAGGAEALFEEEGGGPGFRVAEARRQWMERWLIPGFGVATAVYLMAWGLLAIRDLLREEFPHPIKSAAQTWLIALAVVMLFLFLFSRWASGLARVREWQLLRACGSFMLGNAAATLAVIVALSVYISTPADIDAWERGVAFGIPGLMILLGLETLINFLLDIYRPRVPGEEPRAAFDSRVLGLIAEPGGITTTIADAINYQFGFQVSQTWFYQLLQRAFLPLIAVGALALWLLTCVVVVQPYELAIIERFGRQVNAENPLQPGFHWKAPWPVEVARKYNTGELHELVIGHSIEADETGPRTAEELEQERHEALGTALWTDEKHVGEEHFNFLVVPPPKLENQDSTLPGDEASAPSAAPQPRAERAPVNIMRFKMVIQYRILPEKLAEFSQNLADPHRTLRDAAWQETVRFAASSGTLDLLGAKRTIAGELLRQRISRRVEDLHLGLELVYVGLLGIHPEKSVAEAFRNVIAAEQDKLTEIRKARVTEDERLSRVAGSPTQALELYEAIQNRDEFDERWNRRLNALRAGGQAAPENLLERTEQLRPLVEAQVQAELAHARARQHADRVQQDFELGLGGSKRAVQAARDRAAELEAELASANERLEQTMESLEQGLPEELIELARSRFSLDYWDRESRRLFADVEGEAAVQIAKAQADRWEAEMSAAGEVAVFSRELAAYQAAPQIFRARRYLQVITSGLRNSRKYFLAFDARGRNVHVRMEAQDEMPTSLSELEENANR